MCAGTIIGRVYGVAKKATAIAVKVFDASGQGTARYAIHETGTVCKVYVHL